MKATISISKPELLTILSSHYGFTVVNVEVVQPSTMAMEIRKTVEQFDYRGSQKISAIKAIRQLGIDQKWNDGIVIGLADAKWAIENFVEFISFVETNDRLPDSGYSDGLK